MKKNKIYILIALLLLTAYNGAGAFDYYPELGNDPFYSSLNPMYINPEDNQVNEESTVMHWIKSKFKKNKDGQETEKSQTEQQETSFLILGENDNIFSTETGETAKETKEREKPKKEKPKKRLTGQQLVRELEKEEREKEKAEEAAKKRQSGEPDKTIIDYLTSPFKSFRDKKKAEQEAKEEEERLNNADIEFTADYMEYFPDRFEAEAIGNAKVEFKKSNIILRANKIVFNYDRNTLKATENVVLTSEGSVTEGDYLKIDLNNPDGWFENPVTDTEDVKMSAKEAYIYSDRIEEYDGVAKIIKEDTISFGGRSFASYLSQRELMETGGFKQTAGDNGVYKLKANTIIVDAKKDHEVITVKNADLYLKNIRIAKIPSVKIVTNKDHASAETNLPEFGSQSLLGMHIGPAVVLNVPGGSTLKLAPLLTYYKEELGIGGIARFRNASNMTEVAYGTSAEELLVRGRQKLAPGTILEYSRLTNENEWFLGYRKPKYAAQVSYSRSDDIDDLNLKFSQRFSAGAFVDYDRTHSKKISKDTEWRFRWMTQTYKPLYSFANDESSVGINFGLAAQTAATAYTTGDVTGLARFGPVINTKVGPWNQSLMYFQSAVAGDSPFDFDRYRYGHSNFMFVESVKICKYLSIGYLASLAMNRTNPKDNLFQENRALVSIGPDYAKITIGYDTIRHNTGVVLSMLVGTKDSDIEYKKSIIKNPNQLGNKSNNKKKEFKSKSKRHYLKKLEEIEAANPPADEV